MARDTITCSGLTSKVVQDLKIYDDPMYGREVHIDFTDGTVFSVRLKVSTSVEAKHYRESNGQLDIIEEYADLATAG